MTGSKRLSAIVLIVVIALFLLSWIIKAIGLENSANNVGLWFSIRDAFFITMAAFLTLAIFYGKMSARK